MDEILEQARRGCVQRLSELVDRNTILEPALRTADGALAYDPQGLNIPLRKDVATKKGDSCVTSDVNAPTIRTAASISWLWKDSLEVCLDALTWDYAKFLLSPGLPDVNWMPVRDWFLRWFDLEDTNQITPEGLLGVVHCMVDPEEEAGKIRLTVDFGSAPTRAFKELLDCFTKLGFARCEIG